jgi:HK97 family phage prohead protease/HK97 family phage major capsid protein
MKTLTFSASIEAADAGRRIISGKIVPFGNEVGQTNVGNVVFEKGSIQVPNVSKVKLLSQHEQTARGVIGRAQSFHQDDNAMYGTFKVSASADGENMLIKAAEGILDGLSVGVEVISSKERKDGTMVVTAAILKEVSLVETPAFDSARVMDVAAQATDPEDAAEEVIEQIEDEQIAKISEAVKVLEQVQKIEKALEQTENQTESEAEVSDTTPANTEAAAAVNADDASRPTIKAAAPYSAQTVRHGITSMGRYVEAKVKASLGDKDAALWVAAAEDPAVVQAAADSIGSTNPAFNPIQYMKEFVSNTNFGAPARDAISRGQLPTSGMTFQVPSLITPTNAAPTVAVTAESAAPSDTGMTSQYLTGTVSKYAGQQTVTIELLERSNPVFFDELSKQMELAYLKSIDAAIIAGLVSGGTLGTKNYTQNSAGIIDYVSTESPLAYSGTSYFARNILAGTGFWQALLGATDSTGRPIYNASNPWNNAGETNPSSIRGNVLGLDLYVDYQAVSDLTDNAAFIIAPEAATWYESPTSYFSVNNVGNMQVQMAIYGFGSLLVKQAKGIRRWNVA